MTKLAPLLLAIAACGPTTSSTVGLESIDVEPANATVVYANGSTQPLDYTAIGHYHDGHSERLDGATFQLDAAAMRLGTLATAKFTASGDAVGTGKVTATLGALSGETGVSVAVT